ncbi:hypothetical protein EVJ58_g7035, partial [Rhodofomes roseus]
MPPTPTSAPASSALPQKPGSVSTPQPAQSGGLLPIGCAAASTSRPSTPFSLRSSSPASRPSTPGSVYSSSSTNSSMASLALPTPRTSAESLAEPKGYSATARGAQVEGAPAPARPPPQRSAHAPERPARRAPSHADNRALVLRAPGDAYDAHAAELLGAAQEADGEARAYPGG